MRVLDGNHLPASEKRVKPLRGTRAAALPGQALVLYDPEADLVVDLVAGEDAHAQEPTFVPPLVAGAAPGELWIADRNFATRGILAALHARGAAVLVREHGNHPAPTPAGDRTLVGRGATGLIFEQPVDCPPPATAPGGPVLRLRRIEVELDTPLDSGETTLRLLTTLPAAHATAAEVAALYRRRWSVEGLFQRLEAVLHSEVRTLGQPRAALLAFSVAVVAYNVLAVVQAALEAQAAAAAPPDRAPVPLSMYYVAHAVREHYRGMLIAVTAAVWGRTTASGPRTWPRRSGTSRRTSASKPSASTRGANPRARHGLRPREDVQRHVSTARVLQQAKQRRTP